MASNKTFEKINKNDPSDKGLKVITTSEQIIDIDRQIIITSTEIKNLEDNIARLTVDLAARKAELQALEALKG